MTVKGIGITAFTAIIMGIFSHFFGISSALILIGIAYLILAILYMTNREKYDKIITKLKVDRQNAYNRKSEEFKKYIKDDAGSMIFVSAAMFYLAYRLWGQAVDEKYNLLLVILIFSSFYIDTYSMIKSTSWDDYKKKSIMGVFVVAILAIMISSYYTF